MESKSSGTAPFLPSWRLGMAVLQLLMTIVLYANRVNISFAIVCMTSPITRDTNASDSSNVTVSFQEEADFNWSSEVKGLILGSLSMGAVVTQIPCGWLAHRTSPKWLLLIGICIMTIASFVSPIAAQLGWGYLVAIQIIKGLASGSFYPSAFQILAYWAPPDERSILLAISLVGSTLGSVLGFLSAGWLCSHGFAGGWPSVFYITGVIACPVIIAWAVLVSDDPKRHPFVSEGEKLYITDQVKDEISYGKNEKVPWRSLMTSLPVYAIYVADMGTCWLWFTAQTSLPTYFNDVLEMEITTNGALNSLPYIANFVTSLSSSWLADAAIKRNLPKTRIRKLFTSIALVAVSVLVITVGFLKSHQSAAAVALVTLAIGLLGFVRAGHLANQLEVAPRFTAVVSAINNTTCLLVGVLAPVVTGYLTPSGTQQEWRKVFFISSGISLFGALFYAIFASGEVQPWAKVKASENHEDIPLRSKDL